MPMIVCWVHGVKELDWGIKLLFGGSKATELRTARRTDLLGGCWIFRVLWMEVLASSAFLLP